MNLVSDYVDSHKMQRHEAKQLVEEFTNELSMMQGRCIDIGCGPADVTKEILMPSLPPETEIVGADISEYMTKHAKLRYSDDTRLSFITLDIETSQLPTNEIGRYDHAVSFFCLHWCENIRQAFENIYKLLRPNGTALVKFFGHHNGFEVYNSLKNEPLYQPYMQDASRYVPYFQRLKISKDARTYLRKILVETGFDVVQCSMREKSYIYENADVLKNHVVAVNPFVTRMPDEIKNRYIDDLMKILMTHELLIRDHKQKRERILDRYQIVIQAGDKIGMLKF